MLFRAAIYAPHDVAADINSEGDPTDGGPFASVWQSVTRKSELLRGRLGQITVPLWSHMNMPCTAQKTRCVKLTPKHENP